MNKATFNKLTNILMVILLPVNIISAYAHSIDIHEMTGNILVLLFAIHIALHWQWMVMMIKNFLKINKDR